MKQSFRLFRVAGIDVSIHWSWFLVAVYEINQRQGRYHSPVWNAVEYLALFLIVLLHEFGHAIACRQTGGKAEHITLWPLGGIAFVQPPPRAGAVLWSIAAGPLVNVALVPVTIGLYFLGVRLGWRVSARDLEHCLLMVASMNIALLAFNMLPVYPLDGGQILRALLWFVIGRANSLRVVCVVGMLGGLAMAGAAFYYESIWFGILAAFILQRCWLAFKTVRILAAREKLPRHSDFSCPECGEAPVQGDNWICECGTRLDPFATGAVCPQCRKRHAATACLFCGERSEFLRWPAA